MRAFGMLTATPTPDSEPRPADRERLVGQCLHPHPDVPATESDIHQPAMRLGIEPGVVLLALRLLPGQEAIPETAGRRRVEDKLAHVEPIIPFCEHDIARLGIDRSDRRAWNAAT